MSNKKQYWILFLISTTIVVTITIQFYWNYKNYEQNRVRILNEIQLSLDNTIEIYFADFSRKNGFAIIQPQGNSKQFKKEKHKALRNFFKPLKKKFKNIKKVKDSINFKIESIEFTTDDSNEYKNMNLNFMDSLLNSNKAEAKKLNKNYLKKSSLKKFHVFKGRKALDSINLIKGIQKILISITNDTLNNKTIDSIFKKELDNKKININYAFQFFKKDTLFSEFNYQQNKIYELTTEAKSTFLGSEKSYKLHYNEPKKEALIRSLTGILLSFLLSLAVISSLFYLLKIINKQKQLAIIKNDLISNITHEFKTPITTITTALEAIDNFNAINNKEKTQAYIGISKNQINKLHLMVEKLLETATLDSEKLLLQKENVNISTTIENLLQEIQSFNNTKKITYCNKNLKTPIIALDIFHFKNVMNNLIDNAIKYGGNKINITLTSEKNNTKIEIYDNGKGIDKINRDRIFDQFYRIPKGNTHDVKGFGIGLYYTKKIIEKHSGSISVNSTLKNTTFTILLPND